MQLSSGQGIRQRTTFLKQDLPYLRQLYAQLLLPEALASDRTDKGIPGIQGGALDERNKRRRDDGADCGRGSLGAFVGDHGKTEAATAAWQWPSWGSLSYR